MKNNITAWLALLSMPLFFILIAQGCIDSGVSADQDWSIALNDGSVIDSDLYGQLKNNEVSVGPDNGILLEFFLYYNGLYPVDSITLNNVTYDWDNLAYDSRLDIPVYVLPDGDILCNGTRYDVTNMSVKTADKPSERNKDVEPSILYSLNLSNEPGLWQYKADRVVVFYVDGMGLTRYEDAKALGLIPNMTSLGVPIKACCMYPSISEVNSKALVTGLPPTLGDGYFRSTPTVGDTVLDKAGMAGIDAVWVCGSRTPLIINQTIYNTDKNGNGNQDDEAVAEAIRQYDNGSRLIFVHINSPDKVTHNLGPYSDGGRETLRYADTLIGDAISHMEQGTLVIIYADHGHHTTVAGGNHGTLIEDDMFVPIIVTVI